MINLEDPFAMEPSVYGLDRRVGEHVLDVEDERDPAGAGDGPAGGARIFGVDVWQHPEQAKRLICAANSGETVRGVVFDWSRKLLWPAPFTARSLINEHVRTWTGREIELMQRADQIAVDYAAAKAAGNFDVAAVFAGESAGLIHDIPPAAEIVDRIVTEAGEILNGRRNSSVASRA